MCLCCPKAFHQSDDPNTQWYKEYESWLMGMGMGKCPKHIFCSSLIHCTIAEYYANSNFCRRWLWMFCCSSSPPLPLRPYLCLALPLCFMHPKCYTTALWTYCRTEHLINYP
jgi:hypothetical protein